MNTQRLTEIGLKEILYKIIFSRLKTPGNQKNNQTGITIEYINVLRNRSEAGKQISHGRTGKE